MVATTLAITAARDTEQESYLSAEPQINVFKFSYYRYVNFAIETVAYQLFSDANFGNKTYVVIPKKGHLISKMYLEITLPQLTRVDGTYLCWSDSIGYALFKDPVELQIGGSVVDRLFPVCMDMLHELNPDNKKNNKNSLILKSDIYRSTLYNATQEVVLKIPLDFWFTRDYSLALPIVAMPNQDIQLNFSFKKFEELINFDGTIGTNQIYRMLNSRVLVEYIFLDDSILPTYTEKPLQYLIEQQVYNGKEPILDNAQIVNAKIGFDNSCKELLFGFVSTENINNNNYFNYSINTGNNNNYYIPSIQAPQPILPYAEEIGLYLNGIMYYEDYLSEHHFREILPFNVHQIVLDKHIYVMPFCIGGNSITQPTGSLNMSRFDSVILSIRLRNSTPNANLYVFSIAYNVVRIENGILSFAFMNI